jgi:Spy/CpxP family protein refolding chaperone
MMSLRGLLVTAAVVFVAGLGGVWVGTKIFEQPHHGMHEVLHERLNLTSEQNARIETLEREFVAQRETLELEMRAANAELAAAIREEHAFGPRVSAAVEHFHDAMGRLQTETIRHTFAMREVLDSEQQAVFDDVVVDALTPHGNE